MSLLVSFFQGRQASNNAYTHIFGCLKIITKISSGPFPKLCKPATDCFFLRSHNHLNCAIHDATGKINAVDEIVVRTLTRVLTLILEFQSLRGFPLKMARTAMRMASVTAAKHQARSSNAQDFPTKRDRSEDPSRVFSGGPTFPLL